MRSVGRGKGAKQPETESVSTQVVPESAEQAAPIVATTETEAVRAVSRPAIPPQVRKRILRWTFGLLCTALALTVLVFIGLTLRDRLPPGVDFSDAVFSVERISNTGTLPVSGRIEAARVRELALPVAGEVMEVLVEPGRPVNAGDLLLRLDDAQAQYALGRAEAELEQARLVGDPAALALMVPEVVLRRRELARLGLFAPFSGVVSFCRTVPGAWVEARTPLVRIVDAASFFAVVRIAERDCALVSAGRRVTFRFDAYPDLEVEGSVAALAVEATEGAEGDWGVELRLSLDEIPEGLLPGFGFNADILVGEAENTLVLDDRAVIWIESGRSASQTASPFSGGPATPAGPGVPGRVEPQAAESAAPQSDESEAFAFVETGGGEGRPLKRRIVVLRYDDDRVRVLRGLGEGDRVLGLRSELAAP